jgi:hypothetical protein
MSTPATPAAPAVNLPTDEASEPIHNPVLPPEMSQFLSNKTAGTPSLPSTPAAPTPEVRLPVVVESIEGDEDGEDDVDPLFRSLLGEPEKKPEAKPNPEGEGAVKLPEGELKGKEAEAKVRKAFVDQRKALTSQIETLKKQVAEKTGTEAPPEVAEKLTRYEAENKALKSQLDEQEKFVQIASLESSRVYKDSVKIPIEGIKADILRIARENSDDDVTISANEIYKAIQVGDRSTINTILTKLSEADKIELVNLTKEFRSIKDTEKSLRENAKVATAEFENAEAEKAKAGAEYSKAVYDQALVESRKSVELAVKGIFSEVEGADDWNAVVKDANTKFENLSTIHPNQLSPKDVAVLIADHVAGQVLKFKNDKLTAEVIRLTNRLRQKRANTPGAGAGAGNTPLPPSVRKNSTPPTAAEYLASKQGR